MLFNTLSVLTAASVALAAPLNGHWNDTCPEFTLRLHPSAGNMGMKPLQVRNDKVVFGLRRNATAGLVVKAVGGGVLQLVNNATIPEEIIIAENGQLAITGEPVRNATQGWSIQGTGSFVNDVYFHGSQEFYSCTSDEGSMVGGQEVYLLGVSAKYHCDHPFKFTLAATINNGTSC